MYFKLKATHADIAAANPDAFFYPSRLFIAFVIGAIGVGTLTSIAVNAVNSMRATLINSDAAAARSVFGGIASFQALFLAKTGLELSDTEVDWAFQQVRSDADVLLTLLRFPIPASFPLSAARAETAIAETATAWSLVLSSASVRRV